MWWAASLLVKHLRPLQMRQMQQLDLDKFPCCTAWTGLGQPTCCSMTKHREGMLPTCNLNAQLMRTVIRMLAPECS